MKEPDRTTWDRHWHALERDSSLFGRLASLVRRGILARAVRTYFDRYVPARGVFVEVGCGSGEASAAVGGGTRYLVGCDYSMAALANVRPSTYDALVLCDAAALPFRDRVVAGIWNLGVMEHFWPDTGRALLREFRRVLQEGGTAILFWPPEFGSSRWVFAPIEWTVSLLRGRPFRFYPDEVNRLRSRRHALAMLEGTGLELTGAHFSPADAFIHLVVVARRKSA